MESSGNNSNSGRLARERLTVGAMVRIYCGDHHGERLCSQCQELLTYADGRLAHCPFGAEKPTCAKCPIHCYKPAMRERIKQVMRYAGPRMLLRHPWLALRHWLDSLLASRRRRSGDRVHHKPNRGNHGGA